MKKKECIPYFIALCALLIGAFYDYVLTDTLYHQIPVIGIVFERFVLLPLELVTVFTAVLLYQRSHKIGYLVLGFLANVYIVRDFAHYWIDVQSLLSNLIIIVISVMMIALFVWWVKKLPSVFCEQHLHFFIFMTLVLLSAVCITSIMKSAWGRIRYRDMHDIAQFCVWYKPCGLIGNRSFPSGHTTTMSVILCILQWKHNHYETTPISRYIFVALMIIMMAISRMIMGAHFLSDTAAGFMVTYTCYLFIRSRFKRRGYL